mmetsp:Transcript_9809/g.22873  ORF Transcript_9809/g.22873 Transcript_9809/m.22873 type:complete len:223 (+) Transcript_9809:1922-2590(+)
MPAESSCRLPAARSTSKICSASSRVGETTSAPQPSCLPHFCRHSFSSSGTTKASVLPEPVLAAPSTSRPASACGIAARWMSVSRVKPAVPSPASVRCESGRSANLRAHRFAAPSAAASPSAPFPAPLPTHLPAPFPAAASSAAPCGSTSGLAPSGGASSTTRRSSSAISSSSCARRPPLTRFLGGGPIALRAAAAAVVVPAAAALRVRTRGHRARVPWTATG